MIHSRKEIVDDFLAWVSELGDAVARELAERALDRAVLAIWLKQPWAQFRAIEPYRFTSVPGQWSYVLPREVGRISARDGAIRNASRGLDLFPLDQPMLDGYDPTAGTGREQQATPRAYLLDRTTGVSAQPAAGGEVLEALSTDVGDTAVRIVVEGLDGQGVWSRRQVSLTGVTPVDVGTWQRVDRFAKSYPAGVDPPADGLTSEGEVTLRVKADGRVLQTLAADEAAVELPVLTLYPTPAEAELYLVPYLRAPRRLIHDADPLPRFWGNAVFEEMQVQWLQNDGKLISDAQVPRPHLADLIALEQANRVGVTRQRRAYGGFR